MANGYIDFSGIYELIQSKPDPIPCTQQLTEKIGTNEDLQHDKYSNNATVKQTQIKSSYFEKTHLNVFTEPESKQESMNEVEEAVDDLQDAVDGTPVISSYFIAILVREFSTKWFDYKCEDIVKLIMHFYDISPKRDIDERDLNKIIWKDLKTNKSQAIDNKSKPIPAQIMKEFCKVATEKLDDNNWIPIVVIDENHNYYGIEWVLIVCIIDSNSKRYVGISFRYNDELDVFEATTIYSNEREIESKHVLIGLELNYCSNIIPFNNDAGLIIVDGDNDDDEDDVDDSDDDGDYQLQSIADDLPSNW